MNGKEKLVQDLDILKAMVEELANSLRKTRRQARKLLQEAVSS